MGLSNPRKRVKISSDPNNTAWSRSSTIYGRKILQSQGWTPGSALGANSELQSLANSGANTHIKVVLKDDNLGLGAKGLRHDQCTGLDAFQGLLDSLNGKPKRKSLRQEHIHQGTEPAIYGGLGKNGVRFVSGGFLEGKEQEKRPKQPVKGTVKETVPLSDERFPDDKLNDRPVQSRLECEYKAPQHQKSRQKNRHESTESGLDDPVTKVDGPQSATDSTLEERRKKKAERKLKKRKDKKIRRAAHVDVPDTLSTVASKEPICSPIMTTAKNQLDSQAALPLGGRHAVRQRYIRHKRMAMMDSRAMNEDKSCTNLPRAIADEWLNMSRNIMRILEVVVPYFVHSAV